MKIAGASGTYTAFSPEKAVKPPVMKSTPGKRMVFDAQDNFAPSEIDPKGVLSPSRAVKDDRVRQLGATRVQQLAISTFAHKHSGIESDEVHESLDRRRTIAQVGQSTQRGKHAAHAGVICHMGDSVKAHIIGRIVHMGLQENDEAILRAKGATDSDIESLKDDDLEHTDVDATVRSFWQRDSLLGGSKIELGSLNTTYQVDRIINLCVDKRVEAEFRPKVVEWTRDVLAGRLDEITMVKRYAEQLNEFLAKSEIEADDRLDALNMYESYKNRSISIAKDIIAEGSVSVKNLDSLVTAVDTWRKYKLELQTSLKGAAQVNLPSFGYYQHLLQLPQRIFDKIEAGKSDEELAEYAWKVVAKLEAKGLEMGDDEARSFAKEKAKLESMIRGYKLERDGSVFTDEDYLMMFGKFDEESQERVALSPVEKRELALNMIRSPREVTASTDTTTTTTTTTT